MASNGEDGQQLVPEVGRIGAPVVLLGVPDDPDTPWAVGYDFEPVEPLVERWCTLVGCDDEAAARALVARLNDEDSERQAAVFRREAGGNWIQSREQH